MPPSTRPHGWMQTPPWMPDSSGMTVAPDRTTRLDAIVAIVIPVKTGIHAALDPTTRLDANTALDARLLGHDGRTRPYHAAGCHRRHRHSREDGNPCRPRLDHTAGCKH